MHRYPAVWGVREDDEDDYLPCVTSHTLHFPDFPLTDVGSDSMSDLEVAQLQGEEFLRAEIEEEYTSRGLDPPTPTAFNDVEVPPGRVLLAIPWIRLSGRPVRVHMQLEEGVLAFIDGEARRRKMTRTAYVEWMARRIAQMGG